MRSIPLAMIWDLWAHGRWCLITTALAANVLPTFLLGALQAGGEIDPGDQAQITMQMLMVQISMFVFAAGIFMAQGSPARLFALPLTTASLVTWRMLPAMAIVWLETVATTVALNAMFDVSWPVWGPALFVATAVAAHQATFWFFEKSTWIVWAPGLVALGFGLWFLSLCGATFSRMSATHMWSDVKVYEVLTMFAVIVISWYIAVKGVARMRRGESLPSLGIIVWLDRLFDRSPLTDRPFRTAGLAQSWLEWQRKGQAMPAGVVVCLLLGLTGWLIISRDPHDLFQGLFVGGGLLSVLGIVIGIVMGNIGPDDIRYEMGHFRATRPMTSQVMAQTILKAAAKSVLLAWLNWAAAFFILCLILQTTNSFTQVPLPEAFKWWYFPATLIGPWIVVATVATVGLTGRLWIYIWVACAAMSPFFGLLFLRPVLSEQSILRLEQGFVIACGIGFAIGTVWAFATAHRRSLIGSSVIRVASVVFVVLCAAIVLERVLHPVVPAPVCVFTAGLAALAVAPLATAPLAVAWNRNR